MLKTRQPCNFPQQVVKNLESSTGLYVRRTSPDPGLCVRPSYLSCRRTRNSLNPVAGPSKTADSVDNAVEYKNRAQLRKGSVNLSMDLMASIQGSDRVLTATCGNARLLGCVFRESRQSPRHGLKRCGTKCCMGNGATQRAECSFEWWESVLDFQRSSSPPFRGLPEIPILSLLAPFRTSDTPSRFPRLRLAE